MSIFYIPLLAGLLLNLPAVAPVIVMKKTARHLKVSIAVRLYALSIFLILSMLTLSQNITQKYALFPVWLLFAAVVLFTFILVTTARFLRKHLSRGQGRVVILSSFLIVFAIRFNMIFSYEMMGYTINSFKVVWFFSFLFACLLAYIACGDSVVKSNVTSQSHIYQPSKTFSSQSEIDYDIWLKGKNILNDPSLSITEQQRYKDALKQKDEDFS